MYYTKYLPAVWLVIINLAGFIICAIDKNRARNRKWRIPERNIFIAALLGGSIGVYSSLLLFRHKTKHLSFMIGIPVIFAIELGAILYFIKV